MMAREREGTERQSATADSAAIAATKDAPETFETALAKLEAIVRQLEDGQLGLSDSLARYEEGIRCLKQCHAALETAERKVELLTGVDADGNPIATPFDEPSLSLEEKAEARSRRRSRSDAGAGRARTAERKPERADGEARGAEEDRGDDGEKRGRLF